MSFLSCSIFSVLVYRKIKKYLIVIIWKEIPKWQLYSKMLYWRFCVLIFNWILFENCFIEIWSISPLLKYDTLGNCFSLGQFMITLIETTNTRLRLKIFLWYSIVVSLEIWCCGNTHYEGLPRLWNALAVLFMTLPHFQFFPKFLFFSFLLYVQRLLGFQAVEGTWNTEMVLELPAFPSHSASIVEHFCSNVLAGSSPSLQLELGILLPLLVMPSSRIAHCSTHTMLVQQPKTRTISAG